MRTFRLGTAAWAVLMVLAAGAGAAAQEGGGQASRQPRGNANHEVQLHLLVTSAAQDEGAPVPRALEGVVRQLRASLPPSEYRLAATFINRVRDGGAREVKSAGGAPFSQATANSMTPTFFQFSMVEVKLDEEQGMVNMRSFRLGLKVPIQTAAVGGGDKSTSGYPVIQYEDTGITTQLGVRDGEPTLVGTLSTSRPGQLFVVVMTIKRAGP